MEKATQVDKNKRFAELAGIEWHEPVNDPASNEDEYICSCGAKCKGSGGYVTHLPPFHHNPDFTDAREVWNAIPSDERNEFLTYLTNKWCAEEPAPSFAQWLIDLFTDTTGLMRDEAIRWMERGGNE